ncbi:MAG: insulinase family protein [Pseudomonadota bacterium]|nr:insulinase family protein [Pseudomonadota bacterium]
MSGQPFRLLRQERIGALNLTVEEYLHEVTEARHFHLAAQDDNNAFLVAFLTVPQDSTGVAHILEHTALCGSEHYPVRDPFFLMLRRSLNTFMNAMTAADWTAYPFASCNRKDFNNLLDVYLDAAFFPKLAELDFLQEGHRVEFSDPEDPDAPLEFKGVVYNEMKGAMSSPVSTLWQALSASLYPTTTYHHNSGGDPRHIPDLTWEQLTAFHARHYHPSNAVFFTYGNIPAAEHQARIQDKALSRFEHLPVDFSIPDEQRYQEPVTVETDYAVDPAEGTERKTHIVLGWLLGKMTDIDAALAANFLGQLLLDNSASPLRKALETTDLGDSPSPLCGVEDSMHEMLFACGLEGSDPQHAEATEQLILDVLRDVAEQGVPREMADAVLHQLELSRREVGGDRFPYGLQLMFNALPVAIHGGDAVEALAIDAAIEQLRAKLDDPAFIPGLVRDLLLDNPHRVRLTMRPDPELARRQEQSEQERLNAMRQALAQQGRERIIEQAKALEARQALEDDPEILPRVGIEDVAPELRIPEGHAEPIAGIPATWFDRPTNGLVYQQVVVDLPALESELEDLLPLYAACLPEVGSAGRDYLHTQALQAAVTGGVGASANIATRVEDIAGTDGRFVISGKALVRNHGALSQLLLETLTQPRFDELERLQELVAQIRIADENSITGQGHGYAMSAASAGMSPSARLHHRWSGLEGIRFIKALDDGLEDEANLKTFAERLAQIAQRVAAAPRQLLVVSEADCQEEIAVVMAQQWRSAPAVAELPPMRPNGGVGQLVRQGWSTSTQVNFCAKAYPAVPAEHPDAPALAVLGGFLRNGYLHTAIREKGGAYGSGAGYDSDAGAFRFFSYRDPRLKETLADFDRSVTWLHDHKHPERTLEEAILGVISSIDKPGSPAGEAKSAFHAALSGRTPEFRRAQRARVLEVTLDDLRRVGATYLKPEQASIAVVSNSERLAAAGLELEMQHV